MLLIDGVRYEEWKPEGERAEEELEQIVKEHASEIFGENSIYFDIKHKLKSKAGTSTIPDGYVITFGDNPQLHIVEVELFNHSYDHIISQITKIITCLKDSNTWNDIARTIRDEINKDEFTAIKAKKTIKSGEIYEFLYDHISNLASLVIVIDKDRMDVREGIDNITHREIKMLEFQTYKRVGAETVHVHLFEPLYISPKVAIVLEQGETVTSKDTLELPIDERNNIDWHYFGLKKGEQSFFPTPRTRFTLITDIGEIETNVAGNEKGGYWIQRKLADWFEAHPELQVGDKVHITVLERMNKYRLEIVK
jgi:predicted small metal-binding protein